MILKSIFDNLTFGELSSINLGGKHLGEIDPNNYKEVIVHINMAVLELYKRFPIKLSEELIQATVDTTTYIVTSRVLQILEVYASSEPDTVPFEWSIANYNKQSFYLPYETDELLRVVYSEYPEVIDADTVDVDTYDVFLPDELLEALLLYVAGRVYSAVSNDGVQEGMAYMIRFEQSCKEIKRLGTLDNNRADGMAKSKRRGWV